MQLTLGETPRWRGSQAGPAAGRTRLGRRASRSSPVPAGGVLAPSGEASPLPELPPRDLERSRLPVAGWLRGGVSGPSRLDRGSRDPTSAEEARSRGLLTWPGTTNVAREGWEVVC